MGSFELFDKYRVRGLKVERRAVLDQAIKVQLDPLLSGQSDPDYRHAVPSGELGKPTGAGDSIENRHSLFDRKNIRSAHFPENGDLWTVDLLDDDTDERICHELTQLRDDLSLEFDRGPSGRLNFADQWQGNHSVRPDNGSTGEFGLFVNKALDQVLGAQTIFRSWLIRRRWCLALF